MANKKLYIACYDIRDNKRLRKALYLLKSYSCGGQYSCFECFLNAQDKATLLEKVNNIINEKEDSFTIVPIHSTVEPITLGAAIKPLDLSFYLLG